MSKHDLEFKATACLVCHLIGHFGNLTVGLSDVYPRKTSTEYEVEPGSQQGQDTVHSSDIFETGERGEHFPGVMHGSISPETDIEALDQCLVSYKSLNFNLTMLNSFVVDEMLLTLRETDL